jgi:hypothetical protein
MASKPYKRKHHLEWEARRYRCIVCQWTWRKPPRSACPEVPCYRVDDLPSYLVSEPELHRRHLQAAGPPDACYFRLKEPHWLWLFDVHKATPLAQPKLPRFNMAARLKERASLVPVVRLAAGERGRLEAFHLALLRCLPLRAGVAQTAQSGMPMVTRPDAG